MVLPSAAIGIRVMHSQLFGSTPSRIHSAVYRSFGKVPYASTQKTR